MASGYLLKNNFMKKNKKYYTIFFILAAISPDIDILWSWNNINLHRVLTHSLVFLPFFALIISSIFYFFVRKKPNISFLKIFLVSVFWILAHIFLDYIVVWGVPLLYPFSEKYFSLNLYIYIYEPFFLLTFLLIILFIFLKKFFNFKFNSKKILLLNFIFITTLLFRFWENYYAGKLSELNDYLVIPYTQNYSDIFLYNRYRIIKKENWYYNIRDINIFDKKVNWKYKIKIYNWENNCSNMHKWFLFKENWMIWDIRYTAKLFDSNSCFTWKKIK